MSNISDLKTVFASSNCPSDETLMRYVQQKLKMDSLRAMELHLADCDICSDIVEGFQIANNMALVKSDVSEINQRIEKRIALSETKFFSISRNKLYAIAASVLVLAGIGLINYFIVTKKEAIALLDQTKKHTEIITPAPIEKEQFPELTEIVKTENQNAQKPLLMQKQKFAQKKVNTVATDELVAVGSGEEINKSVDANLTSGKAVFETTATATEDVEELAVVTDKKVVSDNSSVRGVGSKQDDNSQSVQPATSAPIQLESISMSKESSSKNKVNRNTSELSISLDDAKKDFTNANYGSAKNKLEQLLLNNPKNEEATFFLAKSERILKEYVKSISHFDKLLINKKSSFFEESEWQKALNLMDLKKNAEALKLLKIIAEGKGKYAYPAAEMMSELGE